MQRLEFPEDQSLLVELALKHQSQRGVIAEKRHHPIHRQLGPLAIAVAGEFREADHDLPLRQHQQKGRVGRHAGLAWNQRYRFNRNHHEQSIDGGL